MKLIFVVLISLIFVNGCIDDTEAEDPPPKDIYLQSETSNVLTLVKRDDVSQVHIQASYLRCTVTFYTDDSSVQHRVDGIFLTDQYCMDYTRAWLEEKMPSLTGAAWHHNAVPRRDINSLKEYHYIKRDSIETSTIQFYPNTNECLVTLNNEPSHLYPIPNMMATAQDCKDAARMWFESNFNAELLSAN